MRLIYSIFYVVTLLLVVSCKKDVPVQQFELVVNAMEGGKVNNSGGIYNEGFKVSIEAIADSGYVFSEWSNGSTANPLTVEVNEDTIITAIFEKAKYALNVSITGSGNVIEEVISTSKEYESGSTIKLTAIALEGSAFSNWSGDIEAIGSVLEFELNTSKSITANFIDIPVVAVIGEGEISKTLLYENGVPVFIRVIAIPSEGWYFRDWSGGIQSTELEVLIPISISNPVSDIIATFIEN